MRALVGLLVLLLLAQPLALAGEGKRIALTFDDAPRGEGPLLGGRERTERLIAALEEAGVEGAMFFVVTERLADTPHAAERLRAYAAAGHRLANHTHSHPWLHRSEAEAYLADVARAEELLEPFEARAPFFRFPYLDEGRSPAKRDALRAGLDALGLRHGYVTVDNYDWYMEALVREAVSAGHELDMDALGEAYVALLLDAVRFYERVAREALGRSPAHVLLLHENDLAALFVGDLVRALEREGFALISAEQAYRDPIAETLPDTLFNGQGRVAAIAHARGGKSPRKLVSAFEDEDALRAEFARRGLLPASE